MADDGQILHEGLTEREREILGLIAEGFTNQQIADQLYLTLDTVKWHNKQTYQKLSVRSRTQAVARARELGLLGGAVTSVKHKLPPQSTIFIGRERELAEVEAHLSDPACRLLTLFGPGGIGKTRLALELARRQVTTYPDGVYFVPFAPVESTAFVARALADGLGLAQTNQREPLEQVVNYLREKSLLMVIDNFEHLLDGVAVLGDILARSSALKLLVTSRERLHLKEEWVYDVPGLRYLTADMAVVEDVELENYEAGQLFMQTARRARADFEPDGDDKTAIMRICQLVGGMPLGIELAASWVRLLSCGEIADEIGRDLDILTTTWRDLPERHRSIQTVLDHSWRLLAAREREAFQQLTVFSGEFRREAALVVAGASARMLLALVDKSFLQRAADERFAIHELVKQYGAEKLRADEAMRAATRLRHCRYHAGLLAERINAVDASENLDEIEGVFDDLQAAWCYAVENAHLDAIQPMAAGFLGYYQLYSWYRAGSGAVEWYQRALACFDPATVDPDQRATISTLYESLGHLYELTNAHEDMLDAFETALENAAADDDLRRGRIYGKMADTWVAMNQHERGHEFYVLAETVLENVSQQDSVWWDEWFRVQTQRMELYYWQNRPDDIAELVDKLRPLIEQHGTVTHRLRYLYLHGMMIARRERFFLSGDMLAYTTEALALSLETGNLSEIANRYFNQSMAYLFSDRLNEAEEHLQIAQRLTEQSGDLVLLSRVLAYYTVVHRRHSDIERTRQYAAYGLRIAREAHMPQYTGHARAQYAWLAWREGDLAETKRQAQAAIDDWGGLGTAQSVVPFRWFALFPLMGVALQEEDVEQAARWAQHMLLPPQQRLPDDLTDLLQGGVAAWDEGQAEVADDLLQQAFRLAEALHYV